MKRFEPRSAADWDEVLALRARLGADERVAAATRAVIEDVRARGSAAVVDAALKFDGLAGGEARFRVTDSEWERTVVAGASPASRDPPSGRGFSAEHG